MPSLKIGCQTYSWEMLAGDWQGAPEQILDAMAAAGYEGVEFSNNTIGRFYTQREAFNRALAARGLRCAAFAYAMNGFSDPTSWERDLAGAEQALRFAAGTGCLLCLGGPSSPNHDRQGEKVAQAVRFYAEVMQRAQSINVPLAVHPHSHHTSLVITAEEYAGLLNAIASLGIGFNPDTGHILRGNLLADDQHCPPDLLAFLRPYRDLIRHVHIKDVDAEGEWKPLGKGITPLAKLLAWLASSDFSGWVVIEEESGAVRTDPALAITANRKILYDLHI